MAKVTATYIAAGEVSKSEKEIIWCVAFCVGNRLNTRNAEKCQQCVHECELYRCGCFGSHEILFISIASGK